MGVYVLVGIIPPIATFELLWPRQFRGVLGRHGGSWIFNRGCGGDGVCGCEEVEVLVYCQVPLFLVIWIMLC